MFRTTKYVETGGYKKNYWIRKNKFSARQEQLVDWVLLGRSIRLSTRGRQKSDEQMDVRFLRGWKVGETYQIPNTRYMPQVQDDKGRH